MKTLNVLILGVILLFSKLGFSQSTYLKISEKDKVSVSYPPGTAFELIDKRGDIVLKASDTPLIYKIDSFYILNVFPAYKKDKDVYNLTTGQIELVASNSYLSSNDHIKSSYQSNGVSLDKSTFFKSESIMKETNVTLEFNNGVIFSYIDGNVNATQNGDQIEIKGKYLIKTALGILKISYDPKNKELWWVYESN